MNRWSTLFFVVAASSLCLVFTQASHSEKRAFVVGVNGYTAMPSLRTAINDATAISKALSAAGYVATMVEDPGLTEFEESWRTFLNSLKVGDAVAFYFAGHGIQIDGANYLLLKDSPGSDAGEKDVLDRAVDFYEMMQRLELRGLAASLYILDACRNNPISDKRVKGDRGQSRGLARIESVYGAFVMYSAGADEEALDYLRDDHTETNSVYVRHLLPLMGKAELSLVDVAKRVQVQVDEDARSNSRTQRPAYFDGIIGQSYLHRLEREGKPLEPTERIVADNAIRLAEFATWDSNCQSRPPPRVKVSATPKYGRILTRSETVVVDTTQFGNACDKSTQRAIGVYYFIDDAVKDGKAIEKVEVAVKHWSVVPTTIVNESFEIDLAARYSKRITQRR